MDKNNVAHIAYKSGDTLRYVSGTPGAFSAPLDLDGSTASPIGKFVYITVDNNNIPQIAYYDSTNKSLKYARYSPSGWYIKTVDGGSGTDVGAYCSIAVDLLGNPQISYYDATNKDLKFAKAIFVTPPVTLPITLKLVNNLFNPKNGEYMISSII